MIQTFMINLFSYFKFEVFSYLNVFVDSFSFTSNQIINTKKTKKTMKKPFDNNYKRDLNNEHLSKNLYIGSKITHWFVRKCLYWLVWKSNILICLKVEHIDLYWFVRKSNILICSKVKFIDLSESRTYWYDSWTHWFVQK